MQFQKGLQLGALYQQLGIDANARITVDIDPQAQKITINDVSAGKHFEIFTAVNPPRILQSSLTVPEWVKKILSAKDDELKKRYMETEGMGDERETVMTELMCRGVNILKLDLGT